MLVPSPEDGLLDLEAYRQVFNAASAVFYKFIGFISVTLLHFV